MPVVIVHWKPTLFSLSPSSSSLLYNPLAHPLALSCHVYPIPFHPLCSLLRNLVLTHACHPDQCTLISRKGCRWERTTEKGERKNEEKEMIGRRKRGRAERKGSKFGTSDIRAHIATARALSRSVISPIVCQRPKGKDRWLLLTASLIGWNRFNCP